MSSDNREIRRILRDLLVPLIQADGGEVYLVAIDDDLVVLHLRGRYSGCPGNTLAIQKVIEPALKRVAPGCTVRVTSGELVPKGAKLVPHLSTPDATLPQ